METTELWEDIIWYEWMYQISNLWNIRSLNYRRKWLIHLLKQYKARTGYMSVTLDGCCLIHRLVAIAFLPNVENKREVNHIDWDKTNNNISNLEWVTPKENVMHAHKLWLVKKKFWKENKTSKAIVQYTKQWDLIKRWYSMTDVQREIWIHKANVSACCKWKVKSAWWFIWKYQTA